MGTCRRGKIFSSGELDAAVKPCPPGAARCPSRSADGATGMGPDGRRFPGAVAAAWLWPPSLLGFSLSRGTFRAFPHRTILCARLQSIRPQSHATALMSLSACSDPLHPGSVTRCHGTSRSPASATTPVVSGYHPDTSTQPLAGPRSRAPPRQSGIPLHRWRVLRKSALACGVGELHSRSHATCRAGRCRSPHNTGRID